MSRGLLSGLRVYAGFTLQGYRIWLHLNAITTGLTTIQFTARLNYSFVLRCGICTSKLSARVGCLVNLSARIVQHGG